MFTHKEPKKKARYSAQANTRSKLHCAKIKKLSAKAYPMCIKTIHGTCSKGYYHNSLFRCKNNFIQTNDWKNIFAWINFEQSTTNMHCFLHTYNSLLKQPILLLLWLSRRFIIISSLRWLIPRDWIYTSMLARVYIYIYIYIYIKSSESQ